MADASRARRRSRQSGFNRVEACLHLSRLLVALRQAPLDRPLEPILIDRCAWWLPLLRRRRGPLWSILAFCLTSLLRRRAGKLSALDERSQPLWGQIYALRFHRRPRRSDWSLEIW